MTITNSKKRRRRFRYHFPLLFIVSALVLFWHEYSTIGNNYFTEKLKAESGDSPSATTTKTTTTTTTSSSSSNRKENQPSLATLTHTKNGNYFPHGPNGLTAIRLIGERHSGTQWITEVLLRCFPTVNVQNALLNQKHWMQHSPAHVIEMVKLYRDNLVGSRIKYGAQYQWEDIADHLEPRSVFNKTFVVVIFRDPYDWMEAMRLIPHHWPNHQQYSQLLKKPSSLRTSSDKRDIVTSQRIDALQNKLTTAEKRLEQQEKAESWIDMKAKELGMNRTEYFNYQRQKQSERSQVWNVEISTINNHVMDHPGNQSSKHAESPINNNVAVPPDEVRRRRLANSMMSDHDLWSSRKRRRPNPREDGLDTIPLPWHTFVHRNLTIGRSRPGALVPRLCQKGFDHGTISPCVETRVYLPPGISRFYSTRLGASANNPIYELQEDGTPYAHPLELRTAKIENFINLPQQWDLGGFHMIRYEDVKTQGTTNLLHTISKAFGIQPQCDPTPPNPEKGNHELESEWETWITEHADWEIEAKVGYKPRG